MGSGNRIDREKRHVDILEHVVKGIRPADARSKSHAEVVDLAVRPWLGGTVVSAVQVWTLDRGDDDEAD